MSEAWRTQWHKIPKYLPTASRPLFPRGDRVTVESFQDKLYNLKGRIFKAFDTIKNAGIEHQVILGHLPITQVRDLATYLYENSIHPELLTKTLELIANNREKILEARLRQLGRYNLAQAHKKHDIDLFSDIGRGFELFGSKLEDDQLRILERMGVIVLKTAAPIIEPPTPPIKEIPTLPAEKADPLPARFAIDPQLKDKVRINQFPESFFAFERWSVAVTIPQEEVDRALEAFLKPENQALADSTARTLREVGGTELHVKFRRTREGIVVEFKAKGAEDQLSASILLIPRSAQQTLL